MLMKVIVRKANVKYPRVKPVEYKLLDEEKILHEVVAVEVPKDAEIVTKEPFSMMLGEKLVKMEKQGRI